MPEDKKHELSKCRFDNARTCLADALMLLNAGSFKSSVNRSYYAVFHAMRAVLALDEIDSKKHSGVIAEFRRLYIKNGKIPIELSGIISKQFDARSHSDYDDFFTVSKEEAEIQYYDAVRAVEIIGEFLEQTEI